MASGVPTYVDDMRPFVCNLEECWPAVNRISTWYGFLGIQVAARKTRLPSQSPGAWAGAVVKTDSYGVSVSCSQDKLDIAKHGLRGGHYNHTGVWEPCEVHDRWFLWKPPPAAAGAALDELLLSHQKRTHLNHLVMNLSSLD